MKAYELDILVTLTPQGIQALRLEGSFDFAMYYHFSMLQL